MPGAPGATVSAARFDGSRPKIARWLLASVGLAVLSVLAWTLGDSVFPVVALPFSAAAAGYLAWRLGRGGPLLTLGADGFVDHRPPTPVAVPWAAVADVRVVERAGQRRRIEVTLVDDDDLRRRWPRWVPGATFVRPIGTLHLSDWLTAAPLAEQAAALHHAWRAGVPDRP